MKFTRTATALAAVLLLAVTWPALAEQRVSFDGTAVSLALPDSFMPMPNGLPGYMDETTMTVVSAIQAPAGLYDQLERIDILQKQRDIIEELGIKGEATVDTVAVGDRTYTIISVTTDMVGKPTNTWTVISDREAAFILSFAQMTLPDSAEAGLDRDAVLEVLASVEVGSPLSFDELAAAGLGLALTPAAPFTFQSVLGPMISLKTQQGSADDKGAPGILITRPPFAAGVPVDEVAVYQLNNMGENTITELAAVPFGGSEGKRLSGQVQRNGVAETFVMYFASVGDAPLVFFASGTPERMDAATIDVIDGIARSVKRMEN